MVFFPQYQRVMCIVSCAHIRIFATAKVQNISETTKMFQVLHLASAGAGMLLKLYHHPVGGR